MIYLDYLATTPCDPRVVEAMLPWFTRDFGNAGSLHAPGRKAAEAVARARAQVAGLLGVTAEEIIFTSGATEANNLAIKGVARYRRPGAPGPETPRRRIVTLATEHKCVLQTVTDLEKEGFEPCVLGVGADGRVDEEAFRQALEVPTLLVSVMAANNETGVIQNLDVLAAMTREAGATVHSDLAQAAGKMPLSLAGLDLASVSGHKLYGPKGIGVLYVRRRPRVRLQPLFSGGGQERLLRSGTLPVPLVVGMGRAAELMREEGAAEAVRLARLRERLLQGLREHWPHLRVNGTGTENFSLLPQLPGALNVCLGESGPPARALLEAVPEVAASLGSACTAGSGASSYVLRAMGLSEARAQRSLRLSVGRFTSEDEIDRAVAMLGAAFSRISRS
ncbi:cysteine desulfurase [Oecophyllibacter saccharovorans]|uniref:cysteine desulfurase family protein n=1 Tax=Oecophyllibacter saccharovorans TaxID=2558360 RepID=UPI001144B71D|nr:cysteine desulfurase family protein [Oecophyllibacter saccharovorans]QDH15245.1 cysteine desulfurase [Oecophyllibacter saccharovorans]